MFRQNARHRTYRPIFGRQIALYFPRWSVPWVSTTNLVAPCVLWRPPRKRESRVLGASSSILPSAQMLQRCEGGPLVPRPKTVVSFLQRAELHTPACARPLHKPKACPWSLSLSKGPSPQPRVSKAATRVRFSCDCRRGVAMPDVVAAAISAANSVTDVKPERPLQ